MYTWVVFESDAQGTGMAEALRSQDEGSSIDDVYDDAKSVWSDEAFQNFGADMVDAKAVVSTLPDSS